VGDRLLVGLFVGDRVLVKVGVVGSGVKVRVGVFVIVPVLDRV
jgi:hypothetical protein